MDYLFAKLDNLFFLSTLHTPMTLSQYIHSTEKIGTQNLQRCYLKKEYEIIKTSNQFTDLKNQQLILTADNIGSYRQGLKYRFLRVYLGNIGEISVDIFS